MIIVTPTLKVGTPDDVVWLSDLEWAPTAEQAIAIIFGGKSALIPLEDWHDTVRTVLRAMDCSEEWIDGRIYFAETGDLLES